MYDFNLYNHLGFQNPYYLDNGGRFVIADRISKLTGELKKTEIDFTALVQILNRGYAFGDRTLIKGIKKSPWMAKPNESGDDWDYYNVPPHNEKSDDAVNIAKNFYQLLKSELYEYVNKHSHIGILLTGGMDSRIVACLLNDMIINGELLNKSILAFTWGDVNSRDVIYAQKIATLFGWNWEHLSVDENQLLNNFKLTVEMGCEFTPIHLHAMSKVAENKEIDCVLAGSFGDSIGRGEYSGVKVKNLSSLRDNISNIAGFLRKDYRKLGLNETESDIDKYHGLFPQKLQYQAYELDQQVHYMRRMLNACMSVINDKIPLYQMFGSPEVFGYIWSMRPELRNDDIYSNILKIYNKKLLDIPWARTGLIFPSTIGTPDKFSKKHHDYGKMIRNGFLEMIAKKIQRDSFVKAQIFSDQSISNMLNLCETKPIKNSFYYEEKLLWIATISDFIERYNITTDYKPVKESLYFSVLGAYEYKAKYYYKKFK